jgi:hypothetical protein
VRFSKLFVSVFLASEFPVLEDKPAFLKIFAVSDHGVDSSSARIAFWIKCYDTFYGRNLKISVINIIFTHSD